MGGLEYAVRARLRGMALVLTMGSAVVGLATPPSALAEVPPDIGIVVRFEQGCPQGAGTLEVLNETRGSAAAANRMPVVWGREGKLARVDQDIGAAIYPIFDLGESTDRGDRVVIRLISENGRLLFASEVPYYPEPLMKPRDGELLVAPEYRLAVRLNCSRIPYGVAADVPWPFISPSLLPATSIAPAPPESPPVALLLIAVFGLSFAGAWRTLSGRRPRSR